MHTHRWRQLIDERLREAVTVLGRVPGVHGFVVGGSVGRGEPWPMSDIDLLPVYVDSTEPATAVDCRRAELVDWWAASGRAQTLDVGRLAFTLTELRDATAGTAEDAAARMADPRWFHGLDKAYGGHAADPDDAPVNAFSAWVGTVWFHPAVVAARIDSWRRQAADALAEATRVRDADPAGATHLLRVSARALRLVMIESWGERLGSMGREWTRFARIAERHGGSARAARIATLAGADPAAAAERVGLAPLWLRERIDLCLAARVAVGERVTPAENARDQLAAFAVHVANHRPDLDGPWTGSPDPSLDAHLAELRDLITEYG